jgi:hypothetical protein
MVFSTETQSTQSSEYFLIKNSLLRASAVSRDSAAITRKQFYSQGASEFSAINDTRSLLWESKAH